MAKTRINLFSDGVDYSKKTEDRPYYLPLEETDGVKIYVSADLLHKYQDIIQEQRQYHNRITKCLIPGKKGKLVVCTHNCEKCPFRYDPDDPELSKNPSPLDYDQFQQRLPISFTDLTEEDQDEFEPASDEDFLADIYLKERKQKMWDEIHKLDAYQQQILDLWSRGVSVREIANKVNKGKSTVSDDINKVIEILRSKCEGF